MRYPKRLARFVVMLAASALSGCGTTDNVIGVMGGAMPGIDSHSSGGEPSLAGNAAGAESGADGATNGESGAAGEGISPPSAGVSGSSSAGAAGSTASSDSDCVVRVATEGSDSNDGQSFGSALRSLQHGLDVASALIRDDVCASVEIWVAAGTYKPTDGTDRTASFQLVSNVAVFGGFIGTESTRAERDFTVNVTTLSGEIASPDEADNSYHVVNGANGATLDGFTITGGHADGNFPEAHGGGMNNVSASPTIANATFTNNFADNGAGMYNESSSPTITNSTFTNNTASYGYGGGMFNSSSSPVITDSTFTGNSAQYSGAGMYNVYGSAPTITHCKFSHNSALEDGGGMYNNSSAPTLTGCTFADNHASSGGGMVNSDSPSTVTDCAFSANTGYLGGGMYNAASSPTVTNGVFADNSVDRTATTTGEGASAGGAMYNDASSPVVTNCTFTQNRAADSGGALFNIDYSTPTLQNSILWGDVRGASADEIVDSDPSSSTTVSYSIVQGGFPSAESTISADPQFVDAASGDLHLKAASPAIDSGNGCASHVTLIDHEGNSRWDIQNLSNETNRVDIGAFEYQGTAGIDTLITAFSCP